MILTASDTAVGRGCDSAVGGASPQIRGESPLLAETEGEFGRGRALGCSPDNRVSIFACVSNFTATQCRTSTLGS